MAAVAMSGLLLSAPTLAADAWQEDLAALQAGLAANYANFEHTLTQRRINLPALAGEAQAALAQAADDAARRQVLERLLAQFRDPHLRIRWPAAPVAETASACPPAATQPGGGIRWDRLDGYASLPGTPFRAGVDARRRIGYLRLASFRERDHAGVCAQAARLLGLAPDADCDERCAGSLDRAIAPLLNVALADTLVQLRQAGARRIVLDLTENPGGSDWVESALRVVGGPLKSAPVSMLKHPAWRSYLDETLSLLPQSPEFVSLRQRIQQARQRLDSPCDLSAAWRDVALARGEKPLPCSTLVPGLMHSAGLDAYAAPAAEPARPLELRRFVARREGRYQEGVTALPLFVLVDASTHSAAELFAAALQDAGRATLVGTPTAGAGCGQFTPAGSAFVLPHSAARIETPDCVRLRRDGSSERNGVVPDLLLPWAPSDSAYQRAVKARQALESPRRR